MEPAHLVLDLTDLSLVAETAAVPASCWLFRRGPGDPAAMTDYFLVSLSGDSRTGAEAIARGHAISFADALHYVRDLRQGRAAGEVAARLVVQREQAAIAVGGRQRRVAFGELDLRLRARQIPGHDVLHA